MPFREIRGAFLLEYVTEFMKLITECLVGGSKAQAMKDFVILLFFPARTWDSEKWLLAIRSDLRINLSIARRP